MTLPTLAPMVAPGGGELQSLRHTFDPAQLLVEPDRPARDRVRHGQPRRTSSRVVLARRRHGIVTCATGELVSPPGKITFTAKDEEAVELTGTDARRLRAIWRDIRMVFQDPQSSLNPRLPVIEIVGQCLPEAEGLRGVALAKRVSSLLIDVGPRPEILHRHAGAFSGGAASAARHRPGTWRRTPG